jgi:hypothetical protein
VLAKDHLTLTKVYLMVQWSHFGADVLGMEQFGVITAPQDASLATVDNAGSYLNDLTDDNEEIAGSEGGNAQWNVGGTGFEELLDPVGTIAEHESAFSSQSTLPKQSTPGTPVPWDTSTPRPFFGHTQRLDR